MDDAREEFNLEIEKLEQKLSGVMLPEDLQEKLSLSISRLRVASRLGDYVRNFEEISRYLDWICGLPWNTRSEDILDLDNAKKILNENHFGLQSLKERILEYLAVLKLQKERSIEKKLRAPILCLVGLVGTGKTTMAYSIAKALGRKLARIPFGGLGDPGFLRGRSKMVDQSDPGQIIKALRHAGTKNPVILLDEVDRVVEESRATIMGVLVELLDPEQNQKFTDYYIDYPFDLSEVLFIVTANNTTNISTAVMDRLEPMQMPSYNDEEKTTIGEKFILPKTMTAMGLSGNDLVIESNVWPKIIRPLGFDAGVRTLERNISTICRKAARMVVEGKRGKILVDENNLKEFLQSW